MSDQQQEKHKHQYAFMNGYGWTVDLAQVLLDEYKPFIDQGFELDSLGNHFLGGQGFREFGAQPSGTGQRV